MFLSHNFLRYGKPLAAAAPIVLALSGLPSPAHACTGSADDPSHCINNGQAINGFGGFFNSNLTGIPGTASVPGNTGDDFGQLFLTGLVGLGGPGAITDRAAGGFIDEDSTSDDYRNFVRQGNPVRFGGFNPGAGASSFWNDADLDFIFSGETDNGLTFGGVSDNGLEFEGRIRLNFDEGTDKSGSGVSVGGRVNDKFFNSLFDGIPDAADIDDGTRSFRPTIVADNGLRFTADIEFESTSGGIDEVDVFISGSFGSLRLGDDDSRDRAFSLGASEDSASGGVFRPQITLDNGIRIGVDIASGLGAAGGIPDGSDQPNVSYFTPRFAGFQLGVGNVRSEASGTGVENLSGAGNQFDIGANYVNSFGGLDPSLSARWGIDSAATNFAVGQQSVEGYGNIEGVRIGRIDYAPLDDYGIKVQYSLDGGVAVVTNPDTSAQGGNTPQPTPPQPVAPEPVTGTSVGTMSFANQGQRSEVNLIRTEDGKVHAVDSESGHDFGTVHESRSGFGWSFDSPPVPAPTPPDPAAADPIATLDQKTVFSDGFESGNTTAWAGIKVGF